MLKAYTCISPIYPSSTNIHYINNFQTGKNLKGNLKGWITLLHTQGPNLHALELWQLNCYEGFSFQIMTVTLYKEQGTWQCKKKSRQLGTFKVLTLFLYWVPLHCFPSSCVAIYYHVTACYSMLQNVNISLYTSKPLH